MFYRTITKQDIQLFIRQNGYAWPGGYPMVLVMTVGEVLDVKCAKENYRLIRNTMRDGARRDSWSPFAVDVYWEGPPLHCAHCGGKIESAYDGEE